MKRAIGVLVVCAVCSVYGSEPFWPEVAISSMPASPSVGQTITFDGRGSYDPDGMIVSYRWTLPGQAFCISGINTSIAKCKFNAPGIYTVTLTVKDNDGLYSSEEYQIPVTAATNTLWYVRPDGNDDNDGSVDSSSGAFRTIQTAIDSASTGDQIRVYGGIYYEQLHLKGKDVSIYSYNPANPGCRESADNAIIDANKQGTAVMFGGNEPNSCQFKGLTIRGGFPRGDSLAVHLSFDDPDTIPLDSSGKGRNGIINGDPSRVAGYDGLVNGAMEFNGNDRIQIEGYKGVAGKHPRSCAMWVKTSTVNTEKMLLTWGKETTGQKWQLFISSSNKLGLGIWEGRLESTRTITDGNWHHVAAVFEGNGAINVRDVKLYVDGVQESTTCSNYVMTPPDVNTELDGNVYVGARTGENPAYYTGAMDDVRIYSRALSEAEVKIMSQAPVSQVHLKLDGNASDASGNQHYGTVEGNPNWINSGRIHGALDLDGTGDYVTLPEGILNPAATPFSVFTWVRPEQETLSTYQAIIQQFDEGTNLGRTLLLRTSDNKLSSSLGGSPTMTSQAIFTQAGQWYHVGATYDGQKITLYVNGQEVVSSYKTAEFCNGGWIIGRHKTDTATYWNGAIDDLQIYKRVLTLDEIRQIAGHQDPVAHWTMDSISGNTVSDSTSENHTGTLNTAIPTSICAAGRVGNAVQLRNNEYIQIESWNGIAGSSSRSCTAWIKFSSTTGLDKTIASWGAEADGQKWMFRIGSTNRLEVGAWNGYIRGTTDLGDGRWHHVAAVLSADSNTTVSDVQLYVDGIMELATCVNPDRLVNTVNTETVYIGAVQNNNVMMNFFVGVLDDIRIYDRALSLEDIRHMAGDVGLMAYWALDDVTGATSGDSSGNRIDGTWQGSPQPSAEGYFAGAVEFDGINDSISTSYAGVLGNRDRTVSAWIKAAADNSLTVRSIVSWGSTAQGAFWNLSVSTDSQYGSQGALRLGTYNAHVIGSTPINDNRWHHVAAVFENDGTPNTEDIRLYVDGRQEVLSNILSAPLNTVQGDSVKIGVSGSAWFFKGKIDDVRIYDRALSNIELRQMYEETVGGGIVGHGASASIQQCIITNNVSAGNGGGIDFLNGFISQCSILNNRAEGDGGGLWGGRGSIFNCKIAGNQSLRGGGIFNYSTQAMIDRCLFEANCAKQTGGAIYNVLSDLVFKSCLFQGNLDQGFLPVFPNASLLSVLPDWSWESSFGGIGQYIEQDLSVTSTSYPGQTGGTEYQIRWGQVTNNVTENKSGLGFTGYAPPIRSITVNEPFEIGRLRHFNNPVNAGSPPSRVDIEINLALECGSQLSQSFTFSLAINETPNTSNLSDPAAKNWADRDYITFPVSYPSQLIEIEGRLYTLKIIGFQTEQGQLVNQFESPEHGTNTVYLWAQIAPPPADGAITNLASNIWVGNCVFVGNTSCSYGAALSNWACDNVFVGNSTITANHGELCGGIYNHESNITVVNSILWGNTDVEGLSVRDKQFYNCGKGTVSVTYSCIQDANSLDGNIYPGTGNIDRAPLFQLSPSDGGDGWGSGNNDAYGILYLSENSPCIDAGTNAPVLTYSILTDIFGHVRRFDCLTTVDTGSGTAPIVDIGAYEYGNNTAPVAVQDQASTSEGAAVVIDVLTNDYDVDGDAITIDAISVQPSHGTAVISGNTIVYSPVAGYSGSDVFNYRIVDGALVSNDATVHIQITSNHVYVNAGPNQAIQLPNNRVYLDGVIQGLPSGSSPEWRVLSRPTGGAVSFDSSVSVMPAGHDVWDSWASFSLPGMYVLELGVAVAGQEYKDQVVVNVRPGVISGNQPPQVDAWATPSEITLPLGTTLNWTISDDGVSRGELTQEWSVVSGPTSGRVAFGPYSTQSRTTTVSFSTDGTYILNLEVSDGIDKTDVLVYVTVGSDPAYENNMPPFAEAGENQTVVLPVDQSYTFTHFGASVGDETATGILTIHWSVLKSVYNDKDGIEREGNSAVAIAEPTELNPRLTFFRPGEYTLQLKADDGQYSAADTVVFTVHNGIPESSPIQIEAGPDQTITLPAPAMLSEAMVIETATGLPYPTEGLEITWRKVKGPGEVTFNQNGGSGNGTQELNPEAVFSKPGEYDLELQISTGEMKLADQIRIKVYPGTRLATAAHSSYFINEYGQVWATGSNVYGQLGNGTSGYDPNEKQDYVGRGWWYDHYTYSPVLAGEQKLQTNEDVLTNICSIGGGWASSYALDYNGNVWSWGNNSFGQLGIGRENLSVFTPVNEPRKVLAGEQPSASGYLEDIVAISTSTLSEHTLAVDKHGGVWAWGYNYGGVLGNGYHDLDLFAGSEASPKGRKGPADIIDKSMIRSIPIRVGSSPSILDAYFKFDTCLSTYRDYSGNRREFVAETCGYSGDDQSNLTNYRFESTTFEDITDDIDIEIYLRCWQFNGDGILRFDPNYYGVSANNPRSVSFWIKDPNMYCRGTVLSWGNPEVAGGLWEIRIESGHVAVYADDIHCIQTEEVMEPNSWNHIVVVFPENGSLLSHTRIYLTQEDEQLCLPAKTVCATDQVVNTVQYESCRIGASQNNDPNYNYHGYLDELQIYRTELPQEDINYIHQYPYYTAPLKNITAVSAGACHSLALEKDDSTPAHQGRVYSWGDNDFWFIEEGQGLLVSGKLGFSDSTYISRSSDRMQVLPGCVITGEQRHPSGYLSEIAAIAAGTHHSLALEKYTEDVNDLYSGRVLAWGWDYVGILTYFNENTEYQFPDGNTGSAYYGGRIGRGNTTIGNPFVFPSPVYVFGPDLNGNGSHDSEEGYLENIIAISAGESHSMALDKDGHVWVWGNNTHGQLGIGDQSIESSGFPVMVRAPQDYHNPAGHLGDPEQGKIIAIMAGPWHCLALDEYGEIWAWGASWAIGCGEPGYHGTFLPQKISYSQKVKRISSGIATWYGDIRAAIDESVEGDEIIVYPGIYNGFTLRGYSDLNPYGRRDPNVIIRSWNCDDPNEHHKPILLGVDTIVEISNNHSTVKGFVISGGQYGIKLENSNSVISNNVLESNAEAGIYCDGNSNSVIAQNIIGNGNSTCKVGIETTKAASVTIFSNIIKRNLTGIKIGSPDVKLWNNTIVKNRQKGIELVSGVTIQPTIRNCIIWGNGSNANQNLDPYNQFVNLDYCAIQEGQFVPASLFHKAIIDNSGSAFADTNEWHFFPLNSTFLDREITDPNEDDNPNNCIDEGCPLPDAPWVQYLAQRDVESKRRIADSKIDLGANEYIAYTVEAGQDKTVGVNEIVFMNDAAVYKDGSACADIWPYGVQWELLERPTGSEFFIPGQLAGLINPGWRLDICGKYVFQINLYDAQGTWVDSDLVTVTAGVNVKIAPVSDVQLQYDADTGEVKAEVSLQGIVRGINPQIVQVLWLVPSEAILGPVSGLTEQEGAYHTSTSALCYLPGGYEIRLQLLDMQSNVIAEDVIVVDVAELAYQADAGPDITVPWQNNPVSVPLSGRVLPYSNGNESFLWRFVKGPAGGLQFSPDNNAGSTESAVQNPQATFTKPGIYHIQFAVINPSGCFVDDLTVIIDTKDIPLAAEAGANLDCVLNNNIAAVTPQKAFVYPVEGVSVQWYDPSGTPIAGATAVNSTLTFTQPGVYRCKLKATRGQETAEDTVQITVHPQPADSLLIRTGHYGPVAAGRAFTLEDAYIWYSQNTPLSIEWSSNDEQHVKFFPTSDEGVTSRALTPSVVFEAGLAKSYQLTLKVYQESVLLGSASVTIQAITGGDPGLDSDTTPPVLALTPGLLDDANKLMPMPESTAVIKAGTIVLDIYALDAGSRLKSVKIEDTCNSITTLVEDFDFSNTDPEYPSQMQVIGYLEIMKLVTGSHSVKVTAIDRANNITEQTITFIVGRDVVNQTGKPFAWISNLDSTQIEIGKLGNQEVLPEITDGLYEIEGLACHAHSNQCVEFKFELYDEAAVGYILESWATLDGQNPPYPDYFVQNLQVENPDLARSNEDQSYYVGPVGHRNDAAGLGYEAGSFGQLDLTGIENGRYCLLLTVRSRPDKNTAYAYSYVYKKIKLNSPLKIGNLKFSQEDVAIDVGGVPLRVVRTYNSFQKDKHSEFGYGWSYSIANMDIQLNETRQPMQVYMSNSTMSVRVGDNFDRDVTLTLPDGRRVTFAFGLELKKPELYNGQMQYYAAKYTSPEGVSARLETLSEERLTLLNTWANQKTASFVSGSGNYSDPGFYDFEGYRLILEDGTSYVFRRSYVGEDFVEYGTSIAYVEPRGPLYLSEIGLPTGERIDLNVDLSNGRIGQIDSAGVEHIDLLGTPTKAIKIGYDPQGRIVEVWGPKEQGGALPTVKYEYDTAGNLWNVSKLVNPNTDPNSRYETLTYSYADGTHIPSDHYVTAIIDPRGLQPIRYEYDAAGRLIATVDAKGNRIAITHDVSSRQEIVTDRAGKSTIYEYDKRGNVLSVTDSAGKETRYTYDSENRFGPDRQLSVTTRVPNPDDPLQLVDAVTRYDYAYYEDSGKPEYGRLKTQTVIDPAKNLSETEYDTKGNVIRVTQKKWDESTSAYVEVLTTRTAYVGANDSSGLKNLPYFTGTTTGEGAAMVWHSISLTRYDDRGRIQQSVQVKMDNSTVEQLLNSDKTPKSYSELFNTWSANASNSTVTSYTYFSYATDSGYSPDQPYSVTGPDGQTQYFWYDADNHQLASWTLWDDTATGANPDKRILTYNQPDVQGRTIATFRVVQDLTVAGTPMDVAVLLAHLNEQQAGVEAVALSYSDYNSIGKVNTSIDENGILTQYHYDETGNLAETLVYSSFAAYQANYTNYLTTGDTTGILTISRTLYDMEGRAIVAVGPYDPADTAHSPVGTETVYDALGRVERTRRWADVDILFDYVMKSGKLLYVTLAQDRVAGGAWTSTPGQTQLAWTSGGKVPVIMVNLAWWQAGPLSYSRTEYDAAGRVWKSYSLNESNAEICTAEYRYDTAGRQIRTITLPDDTTGKRSETVTVYDGTRRQSVTDGLGHTTSFVYDALGRVITTIHPASLVEGSGTTPVETYSHVGYDSLGRKWWEAEQTTIESYIGPGDPDFDRNNPDHVALYKSVNTKEYEYDYAGRLIAVVLPRVEINDPTTPAVDSIWVYPRYEYAYDAYGNQSVIRENLYQLKRSWEVGFNPATDIVSAYSHQTVFGYDGLHRQISRTVPGCGTEYKGYDSHNRLLWEMDFKGQVTGYAYDALGRLEYKRYYAADATPGDFQNSHYPSTPAEVLHYTYDNLGRKLTETVTDYTGTPTVTYDASYSYDDEGNVTEIVTPQGTVHYDYHPTTGRKSFTRKGSELATEYGYDELGRLKTTRAMVRNGQLLSPTELTTYEYDLVGNRKSATLPDGVYTEYSYNSLNRLTDLVHYQTTAKTTVVGSYFYQLNAAGMRKGAGEFLAYPSGSQSPVVEYDYDGLNRLVGESNKHNGTTGFVAGYVYDLVGNRLGRTVIAPNGTLDTTYDYYPGTDRLYHEYQAGPVAAIPLGQNETVYAYHTPSGGLSYQMPGETGRIGALTAFLYGVPSIWGTILLMSLLICLPVAGLWPVLVRILRGQEGGPRPSLSLYHRCLCVLLAYVFLIGPECLLHLSQAATQYSQISTLAWGRGNSIITYGYDANGSLTSKTTTRGGQTAETVIYTYNLQNRLARVETTPAGGTTVTVDYHYNPDGIRVGKTETTPAGTTATAYLIDPANPTGYAQVLEETTARYDAADVLLSVERTAYVIGEDVISQTKSNCDLGTSVWTASATQYLLYDGHGSTRQLMSANLTVQDSYSYDGYGVMLGSAAGSANAAQTNLLYCGEQYDSALSQYYLRARYYNPANGLFNQLDPYAGNMQDPQSLHKYLYCHGNPVNGVDPSGEAYTAIETLTVTTVMSKIMVAAFPHVIAGVLALTTATLLCMIYQMSQEYLAMGLSATAEAIRSSARQISDALRDAAKALKDTIKNLLNQKPYFVFERFTPNIYKFTASCLVWNPSWYYLTWHGNATRTAQNRAWVLSQYGNLRGPGFNSIDEFPYASTLEGGWPFAKGCAVPLKENLIQGGYLRAHYYGILRKPMTQFLVLPVPR